MRLSCSYFKNRFIKIEDQFLLILIPLDTEVWSELNFDIILSYGTLKMQDKVMVHFLFIGTEGTEG